VLQRGCGSAVGVSPLEIKNLRWQDGDLFGRVATIRRSKTAAGHRTIPLNGDAMAALARLLERARALGSSEPEHYVFRACEERIIDPSRAGRRSWRTAWRKLVRETARRVGREAAQEALSSGKGLLGAIGAWKRAAAPIRGLRFHDLRHQALYRNGGSGRIRRDADGRRGPHVSPHAGALQPRTHGREAHGAGKTGKRFNGWALGNESARVEENELSPYVTIHVTTTLPNSYR
jgi:integrase